MKWFIVLIVFTIPVSAGMLIDDDGDGLYCVIEDDGVYCGEDDQDKCDGIPNVSINDNHCSVDLSGDGYFTFIDLLINAVRIDHPLAEGGYGGDACYYTIRVIEYNRRLAMVGLPLLQRDLVSEFIVAVPPVHCEGHHTYPPIQ